MRRWLTAPLWICTYSYRALLAAAQQPILHGEPLPGPAAAASPKTPKPYRRIPVWQAWGIGWVITIVLGICIAILAEALGMTATLEVLVLAMIVTAGGVWTHVILTAYHRR